MRTPGTLFPQPRGEAADRRDVGMAERREHLGFTLEPGEAIRVARHEAGSTLIATWPFRLLSVAR